MDTDDRKCLACHTEIASRISSKRGYHRDKSEGCALCHPEHQGKEARLIVMDILGFDHDETGHILKDAHEKVKDCSACHQSPHPGRQGQCQTCHTQKNWRVDIWSSRDI